MYNKIVSALGLFGLLAVAGVHADYKIKYCKQEISEIEELRKFLSEHKTTTCHENHIGRINCDSERDQGRWDFYIRLSGELERKIKVYDAECK